MLLPAPYTIADWSPRPAACSTSYVRCSCSPRGARSKYGRTVTQISPEFIAIERQDCPPRRRDAPPNANVLHRAGALDHGDPPSPILSDAQPRSLTSQYLRTRRNTACEPPQAFAPLHGATSAVESSGARTLNSGPFCASASLRLCVKFRLSIRAKQNRLVSTTIVASSADPFL